MKISTIRYSSISQFEQKQKINKPQSAKTLCNFYSSTKKLGKAKANNIEEYNDVITKRLYGNHPDGHLYYSDIKCIDFNQSTYSSRTSIDIWGSNQKFSHSLVIKKRKQKPKPFKPHINEIINKKIDLEKKKIASLQIRDYRIKNEKIEQKNEINKQKYNKTTRRIRLINLKDKKSQKLLSLDYLIRKNRHERIINLETIKVKKEYDIFLSSL